MHVPDSQVSHPNGMKAHSVPDGAGSSQDFILFGASSTKVPYLASHFSFVISGTHYHFIGSEP